jgi:hypothetical protein
MAPIVRGAGAERELLMAHGASPPNPRPEGPQRCPDQRPQDGQPVLVALPEEIGHWYSLTQGL